MIENKIVVNVMHEAYLFLNHPVEIGGVLLGGLVIRTLPTSSRLVWPYNLPASNWLILETHNRRLPASIVVGDHAWKAL